jgi:CDP-diacylglycerol--glycerol-3-phosphate 3-phosphatidyltransferase
MPLSQLTRTIPLLLTALRALLAPVVVCLALYRPLPAAFGACLVAAFVSDIFDGVIARRLGVATPNLRRLDSVADSIFYAAAVFAAWHLHPAAITERIAPLSLLALLEISRYAFDFIKFGREASYHMWSSKLWGIALFAGFFALLVQGAPGWPVSIAVFIGIIADLEGLAISVALRDWQTDVPTLFHAIRLQGTARNRQGAGPAGASRRN